MVKKQEVAPVAAVPPMESSAVRVDSYHGNAPLALAEEIESALAGDQKPPPPRQDQSGNQRRRGELFPLR